METTLRSYFSEVLCLSVVSGCLSHLVTLAASHVHQGDESADWHHLVTRGACHMALFSNLAQAWFSFGMSDRRARLGALFSADPARNEQRPQHNAGQWARSHPW